MPDWLKTTERLARARSDLRIGAPIVLIAGQRAAVAISAEVVSDERLNLLRGVATGNPDLAVTSRRAETLRARSYDGDLARIAMPSDLRASDVRDIADPSRALDRPMLGPFMTRRDGDADLHRAAIRLCKQARVLPASVLALLTDAEEGRALSMSENLSIVDAADVVDESSADLTLSPVSAARVPLETAENSRVHVFRPDEGGEEHYAVEIGDPPRDQPVLSRLHSACFTGDLMHSLKCDCGPQLQAALRHIGQAGAGVLLYLNQEGRGIGLANKMRAYSLQDQGFDTVDANHRLGFEDDERDFRIGAEILKRLGFSSVRLMTNNPGKLTMMERCGVKVAEHVPLVIPPNPHNVAYLKTKAAKSGHLL